MKAAFFFDTILLKDKNNDYYGITLFYEFFQKRYIEIFENMVVSTRVKEIQETNFDISGYKKTNGENVEVKPIYSYNDIPDAIKNGKKIRREVDNIISEVDKVIIRMPSVIGMFACESAKKYNKPYLIEMVACPWDGYLNHTRKTGKLIAPIMFLFNRKYVKNATNVLYVTREFLQKRYPNNRNNIDCSDVILKETDNKILETRKQKILNEKEDEQIIISTVGSVGLKSKGQEFVMQAIAKLKDDMKIKYYLAGGGDDKRLRQIAKKLEIEENVEFLGAITHDEVFELLDKTDIYIQPSLQEGLPRALIEAMSRACPAIGSSTGGIPELLDKKYIFKKKKVNSLLNIIKNISKQDLLEQAEKNYNKAKEYNAENLDKKRKEFYANIK